jgi:hypothetical protein
MIAFKKVDLPAFGNPERQIKLPRLPMLQPCIVKSTSSAGGL